MKKATAKKQKIRSLVGRRYFAATGVHRCGTPAKKNIKEGACDNDRCFEQLEKQLREGLFGVALFVFTMGLDP